jgi:hypothetical protein
MIRILTFLMLMLPFAASAVTDTPTRTILEDPDDGAIYRFVTGEEDLVPILETLGDSVFFGAHINTTTWSGTNDPQPFMIVSGLGTDGGLTNRYIRFQGDKTGSGTEHQLDLRMTEYGDSTGDHTRISTPMALSTWYAIGAEITVTQVDPTNMLSVKVYQQEHGTGTPLTTERNDIPFTWVNLKIFAIAKHCYDPDNDGLVGGCGHFFIGDIATPVWVHNATDVDILKFMDKVHPDNLWSGTDYIIQPNMDTLAEKTGGIGWTTNGTLGSVGTLTLDEDGEAPVQDPTFLGITLSWIESLWLSVQTAMVPDAH